MLQGTTNGDQDQEPAGSRQSEVQGGEVEPVARQIVDSGASVGFAVDASVAFAADVVRTGTDSGGQGLEARLWHRLGRYHYEVRRHARERLLTENIQWRTGRIGHAGVWQGQLAVVWSTAGRHALCVWVLVVRLSETAGPAFTT